MVIPDTHVPFAELYLLYTLPVSSDTTVRFWTPFFWAKKVSNVVGGGALSLLALLLLVFVIMVADIAVYMKGCASATSGCCCPVVQQQELVFTRAEESRISLGDAMAWYP